MPHRIHEEVGVGLALELCDRGLYREARAALGPHEESAEYLLVAGIIATNLGQAEQGRGYQEEGKDLLTKSARLFGDRVEKAEAIAMLALCYWRCGEQSEAMITVDDALRINPLSFRALIVKSIIQSDRGELSPSLATLKSIDVDRLSVADKGRFHTQRGRVYREQANYQIRKLAEATRDKSIIDYEAAAIYFEQIGHVLGLASVKNNLAGLYADFQKYEEAHANADEAIALFSDIQERGPLAHAYDQKARIYLKQHNAPEALSVATKAVHLLQPGEQKAWLAEVSITYKRSEIMKRNEDDERELIKKALTATEGSTTKAAVLLGLTQPGLAFKLKNQYPDLLHLRKVPRQRRKIKPKK